MDSLVKKFRRRLGLIERFGFSNYIFIQKNNKKIAEQDFNTINPVQKDLDHIRTKYNEYIENIEVITFPENVNETDIEKINLQISTCDKEYLLFSSEDTKLSEFMLPVLNINSKNYPMADAFYADEKIGDEYFFKPDYSPDTLNTGNYIGNTVCIRTEALRAAGLFDADRKNAFLYDSIFKLAECIESSGNKAESCIIHISKVLSFRQKPYNFSDDKNAIEKHLNRIGADFSGIKDLDRGIFDISYNLKDRPLVSIIIPNKDNVSTLKTCLESVINTSTYRNYEIIVVENNSTEKETFEYYRKIEKKEKIHVLKTGIPWNFSAIMNYSVKHCNGKYLLLLNNDTEVISPDWIEQMLAFAERKNVGAVGAKLLYPDGTIQHGGVILGIRGVAGHAFLGFDKESRGYMDRLVRVSNLTAVTAACMMIQKKIFEEVGGFDETYQVAFNDTDFCMRIRKLGYYIIFNPDAKLFHYESKTRGRDEKSEEKRKRFDKEYQHFQREWCKELTLGDPYYNVNLTLESDDFSYKPEFCQIQES